MEKREALRQVMLEIRGNIVELKSEIERLEKDNEKLKWENEGKAIELIEEELQRMGADVHDDLIQRIAEQRLYIEQLTYVEDIVNAQALALKLKATSDLVVKSIRQISNTLLPGSIDSPSLVTALNDLCLRMQVPGVAFISVESSGTEFLIDPKHQLHLVRIVQELVQNAIKHSICWHVWVRLQWEEKIVSVVVEDDGLMRGSTENRHRFSERFRTIRMRQRYTGATLSFEQGEKGLRVTMKYPRIQPFTVPT